MDNSITVKHHDVVITYNERDDKWEFELRNKGRSAESLALAKEAIDKPPPKDKKTFRRFEAFYQGRYGDKLNTVTVTSVAERSQYNRGTEVWVSMPEVVRPGGRGVICPKREKVTLSSLYEASPKNAATIKEINRLRDEIDKKHEAINNMTERLTKITLNPEDFD